MAPIADRSMTFRGSLGSGAAPQTRGGGVMGCGERGTRYRRCGLGRMGCVLQWCLLLLAVAPTTTHGAQDSNQRVRQRRRRRLEGEYFAAMACEPMECVQSGAFGAHIRALRSSGVPFKLLGLVRHGEAGSNEVEARVGHEEWYNTLSRTELYWDAPLTRTGVSQAGALSRVFGDVQRRGLRMETVVTSPLTRTIETALIVFNGTEHWAPPIRADEDVRAVLGLQTCNKRHPRSFLRAEFATVSFDGLEAEDDVLWDAHVRETDQHLQGRVGAFVEAAWHMQETNIGVVSHHGFIGATSDYLGLPRGTDTEAQATAAAPVVVEGGGQFGDVPNAFAQIVVLQRVGPAPPEPQSAIATAGKFFLLLVLLKLLFLVFLYYVWARIKPYVLPRRNVSEGPQENHRSAHSKGPKYAPVPTEVDVDEEAVGGAGTGDSGLGSLS